MKKEKIIRKARPVLNTHIGAHIGMEEADGQSWAVNNILSGLQMHVRKSGATSGTVRGGGGARDLYKNLYIFYKKNRKKTNE
jgi:hypothetical protein